MLFLCDKTTLNEIPVNQSYNFHALTVNTTESICQLATVCGKIFDRWGNFVHNLTPPILI